MQVVECNVSPGSLHVGGEALKVKGRPAQREGVALLDAHSQKLECSSSPGCLGVGGEALSVKGSPA